jgi:hypothetical protein
VDDRKGIIKMKPFQEGIRLKHWIDELYTKHTFLGYRKIAAIMNREGDSITQFGGTCRKWTYLFSSFYYRRWF